ncbi:MAG: 3-deoxy-manno-octulosonate cytidylyltransferase [Chitinophagales bacterium]|nr:3-deoxy-manno-octulosonate cytidylyltransferase [Chitinophagales bacterium]
MKVIGIIPARYASSRFPGKPLAAIGNKTMIRRVYEQALKAKSLSQVWVATDDERICNEVKNFGGKVVITSANHKNGTERCAEAAASLNADIIINIQGDEPFIHPEQIDLLAQCFADANTSISTLIKEHPMNEELHNHARIKVVVNKNMEALYFSRNVIPFVSEHSSVAIKGFAQDEKKQVLVTDTTSGAATVFYKHIGIYGYRADVLQQIVQLPPSPLEMAESLEQLRWLENGYRIRCALTPHESISIDTPEDLEAVKKFL